MSNTDEIARRANNELCNALNNDVDQIVANFRLPVEPSPREVTLNGFEYVTNFLTGGGTRTRKQQHEDEVYKGAVEKWKTQVIMEIARTKGLLKTSLAKYNNDCADNRAKMEMDLQKQLAAERNALKERLCELTNQTLKEVAKIQANATIYAADKKYEIGAAKNELLKQQMQQDATFHTDRMNIETQRLAQNDRLLTLKQQELATMEQNNQRTNETKRFIAAENNAKDYQIAELNRNSKDQRSNNKLQTMERIAQMNDAREEEKSALKREELDFKREKWEFLKGQFQANNNNAHFGRGNGNANSADRQYHPSSSPSSSNNRSLALAVADAESRAPFVDFLSNLTLSSIMRNRDSNSSADEDADDQQHQQSGESGNENDETIMRIVPAHSSAAGLFSRRHRQNP